MPIKESLFQLVLLHRDPYFRLRLQQASPQSVYEVPSWDTAASALAASPASAVLLVDPFLDREPGPEPAPQLEQLLRQCPSALVIAVLPQRLASLRLLQTLSCWRVAEVAFGEQGAEILPLARRLVAARDETHVRWMMHGQPKDAPSAELVRYYTAAAQVARTHDSVKELSRALHTTPRSLQRWCVRVRALLPGETLMWMRLLLAADLLDQRHTNLSGVADAAGYASDGALRSATRAVLGASPRELRAAGAVAATLAALNARLRALAEERPPSSIPPPWRANRRRAGEGPVVSSDTIIV